MPLKLTGVNFMANLHLRRVNCIPMVLSATMLFLVSLTAAAAAVPATELTGALHWRSVGPYLGGRVTSLAGVAGEPSLFYMATAGGGVWKTKDYGHNWENISDRYFRTGSIGAIALAPSNPKIIYAGTGDPAIRNTFLTGDGMYKSTDAGKTWSRIGLEDTGVIGGIIVDPNDPDVVYVAAMGHVWAPNPERGVFKTTDGGRTWKKILYVNEHTGAITLAMDPKNSQVLYAAMWQAYRRHWTFSSGGPGSGIYKTTDGGTHWSNISHNPGLPSGIFGKVGLAVAPSDSSVVYALVQAKYMPGHPGGLFRSDDGGQSWQLMNDSLEITQRAFYYNTVYVDPKDPKTIYLPNADVFVSHDSGKTLTKLHPPHGDNHVFWINPNDPQTLIEGNDGGATVSLDGGKTWSAEDNQPTGQFYHANLDEQFPFHIYGAQQDRGSVEASSAEPAAWTSVSGGEMSWVVPTPGTPWVTYGSGYYSQEWRENRRTRVSTEVNTWGEWQFGSAGDKVDYRYGWMHHPKVFAPHNPKELLVGANVLFETLDEGVHWKVISPDLTRNDKSKQQRPGGPISADVTGEEEFDTISSIAFSPVNDNVIWTGSDDGLVYVTMDSGAHWQEVRPPTLPTWSTITCVEPSHTQPGTAYVSASRYDWDDFHPYLYKTTDYGRHWTEITGGLPENQYIESVREDPDDPTLLLAGTSSTVYMSLDAGVQWQPLTRNLPAVRVSDVEIQPEQHAVVIATFGRAFWVLDDLQFLEQLTSARVAGDAPYLFKPQQTWLVTRRIFGGPGSRNEGKSLPPGVTVFFQLPADYDGKVPVKLDFTDASGKEIRRFTLPILNKKTGKPKQKLHPGMNRFLWDLHYPNAVDVKGIYESPHSQGPKPPVGPAVVPGTYYAVLSYDNRTQKRSFLVELDARLPTTQAELQQRFDLLMQIRDAIGRLDTALNQAIDARGALEKAIADRKVSGTQAQRALAGLNHDIDDLVDLRIQSDEGSLVYAGKLRAWLSWLASEVSASFLPPTPAMLSAANAYVGQEREGVARLRADAKRAEQVLH
ncbi:MAG: WD40/YVTN/BNR-like repeat-containing protein [Steroidobacteraceae bacterium]